jgi:archaellum component FlaF (FlaF/FlaG flagellin family)
MGLSTVYANILMFAVVLTMLSVIVGVYSGYMSDVASETSAQAEYLKGRLDTSVHISAITASTSDSDIRFYVVNDGGTNLETGCVDFYLNRSLVKASDMKELVIINTSFDPGVWNPGETLKMRVQYDTRSGVASEGKVVTCNGVADSMIFYGAG